MEDLDNVDWASLDRLLSSELKRMTFEVYHRRKILMFGLATRVARVVYGSISWDDVKSAMRKKLPKSESRGIIHFRPDRFL